MEDESRGSAIKRRRVALGMQVQELAELASQMALAVGQDKVPREAVTRAEKDESTSDVRYSQLENALMAREHEIGGAPSPSGGDIIELVIEGIYGVRTVRMKGPVSDLPEMEASIARLIKRIEQQSDDE